MRRLRMLAVSLAMVIALLPAYGKPPGGVLKGTVLNAKGQPVSAGRVFCQMADGTAPHSARIDSSGHFELALSRDGLYDVRAQGTGAASKWVHNVTVRNGKETNLTLRLAVAQPPHGAAATPPK